MKKKDNANDINATENTNDKKKSSRPIIITIAVLLLCSCCCCGGIGMLSDKDKESESSSESSSEISVAETTENETEESATAEITTENADIEETTEKATKTESTTEKATEDNSTVSSKTFIDIVKETIRDDVGSNEYITDVVLKDSILTISVDLSKADTTIVSLEDIAVVRAQSITDSFLDLEGYDELWNEIIIDFGDVGFVSRTSDDIVENEYGMRCFEINNLDSQNSANEDISEIPDTQTQELALALIDYSFASQDVFQYDAEYDTESGIYVVKLWYDGLALGITTNPSQFVDFQQTAANTCKTIRESIQSLDPDANLTFFILNDLNKENVLITILNGVVISSVISE